MDHLSVALLIPVAVIVMAGLSEIVRQLTRGRRHPGIASLEAHVDALEHELRSVRQDLSETQERLDFAERLLAQPPERKQVGPTD